MKELGERLRILRGECEAVTGKNGGIIRSETVQY